MDWLSAGIIDPIEPQYSHTELITLSQVKFVKLFSKKIHTQLRQKIHAQPTNATKTLQIQKIPRKGRVSKLIIFNGESKHWPKLVS